MLTKTRLFVNNTSSLSIFGKIDVVLVKLNLSLPLLAFILNYLSLSLIFGALVLTCSLTSHVILLTLTHSLWLRNYTILVLAIILFSLPWSRSRDHSHTVILVLSLLRSHSLMKG